MATLQIRFNKLLNSQKCMFKLLNKTFFILKGFVESSQKFAENFAELKVEIDDFVQSNEGNYDEEMDEMVEETVETSLELIETAKKTFEKLKVKEPIADLLVTWKKRCKLVKRMLKKSRKNTKITRRSNRFRNRVIEIKEAILAEEPVESTNEESEEEVNIPRPVISHRCDICNKELSLERLFENAFACLQWYKTFSMRCLFK